MFVKMSLRERLFMLVDFVGMNLRVLLLPPPSCFLNVFLPTLVTADFKFFFPLILPFQVQHTPTSQLQLFVQLGR